MNLLHYSSFGDSLDLPAPEPSSSVSSLSFSSCGGFLAAGTDIGRVMIVPVIHQKQLIPRMYMTPSFSFTLPQKKFDSGTGMYTSNSVSSLQFSPEIRFNPRLLVSSKSSTYLYDIKRVDTSQWTKHTQQMDLPTKDSPSIAYMNEQLAVFNDNRLGTIVYSDFYSPNAVFVAATNATCIFEARKDTMFLSTSNERIGSASLNKQFPELFLLGKADGAVALYDMRQQPENLSPSFEIKIQNFIPKEHYRDGFYDIKNLKFEKNGVLFAVRTFGDLFVFDIRAPQMPHSQITTQWFKRMDSVTVTGMVSDNFGLDFIDNIRIITGLYNEKMLIWDFENQINNKIELRKPNTKSSIDISTNQCRCISANSKVDLIAASSNESIHFFTIYEDQSENEL